MTVLGRTKRLVTSGALYLGIIVATLAVVDLASMAFGLFPPRHNYGDPNVGWVSARPTGEMVEHRCTVNHAGKQISFVRNEDGVRTSVGVDMLRGASRAFEVAVAGDSQTDLCSPNSEIHFGVLQRELRLSDPTAWVFAYAAGKYSPLQAYLAIKDILADYEPNALVLNFYTGNDFYDMFRVDDRPHFVPVALPGGKKALGYEIADPVWYQLDDPTVQRRSRVLYAIQSVAKRLGVWGVYVRIRYLRRAAADQGQGMTSVVAYMNDLRKSTAPDVGYPAALAAQMLNQQLFFYRFPGSSDESVRRVRALLELVRREQPDLALVMSPIPSYELVQQHPVDDVLTRTLDRLPISYKRGVEEEGELYEVLRDLAAETGWVFVDNLAALQSYRGTERLYNDFDYHILPVASEIIGKAQAAVLRPLAESYRSALP